MAFNWADDVDEAIENQQLPNFANTYDFKTPRGGSPSINHLIDRIYSQKKSAERQPKWRAHRSWRSQSEVRTTPLLALGSPPEEEETLRSSRFRSLVTNTVSSSLKYSPDDGFVEEYPKISARNDFKGASAVASAIKHAITSDLTLEVTGIRGNKILPFENEAFQAGGSDDDSFFQTASETSFGGKSDGAQSEYYTPCESPTLSRSALSGLFQQTFVQSMSINSTIEENIYPKSSGIEGMKVFEDRDCGEQGG